MAHSKSCPRFCIQKRGAQRKKSLDLPGLAIPVLLLPVQLLYGSLFPSELLWGKSNLLPSPPLFAMMLQLLYSYSPNGSDSLVGWFVSSLGGLWSYQSFFLLFPLLFLVSLINSLPRRTKTVVQKKETTTTARTKSTYAGNAIEKGFCIGYRNKAHIYKTTSSGEIRRNVYVSTGLSSLSRAARKNNGREVDDTRGFSTSKLVYHVLASCGRE